jgi:hypothetical protein
MRKSKISPEKIPADEWELVDEKMLLGMYNAAMDRKAKRNKPQTFYGGYGMVVKTRKKHL